ncbi:transferase [Streptomyces sp. 3MP-14]|uniref:Transferase n=1 Tax=Streptomyces mimosae TaxID=2586635 RepID=A0A5N6AQQ8_9ACTN|nr:MULTISPECIES: transferase [Streptomyces]KAB8171021.1 transferase [Streptomyces mimosae]KAB8179628.1 transferase [Streptomyces sp. 3MP-14]
MSQATVEEAPRVDCRVDREGRITFELNLPEARAPQLLLRLRPKKGQEETTGHAVELVAVPGTPGRWRAELGANPRLGEGRWDAYLLPETDRPRLRALPGLRDLRMLAPTTSVEPALDEGVLRVRLPYTTKDGFLSVRAWQRAGHAEVDRLEPGQHAVTVHGRLLGPEFGPGAAAILRRRGKEGPERETALTAGENGAFTFTADYRELPTEPGAAAVWNVFVRPATDAGPVRVGRLLDDVADRKNVFVYPTSTVRGFTYWPYFTLDNDLSIQVDPATEVPGD